MIKKIRITKENKTIKKDFNIELENMTIIVGENNVGKSNFFNEVVGNNVEFLDESDVKIDDKEVEKIHIKSNNIQPAKDELKAGVVSTGFIKTMVELFSSLGIIFTLEKNISDSIVKDLFEKTSENLKKFSNDDNYAVESGVKNELEQKVLVNALIEKVIAREGVDKRDLNDLGQGMQRIIIASVLKAYLDIKKEKGIIDEDKKILILFDEPEVFLHPNFKRSLNNTLEELSKEDNIQVIISTHDPYFSFLNFSEGKKIISFIKNDGITNSEDGEINGIADELLFISLYSKLKKIKDKIDISSIKIKNFREYERHKDGSHGISKGDLGYVRDQIHHKSDNKNTEGLVKKERAKKIEEKSLEINYFTEEELNECIKVMSKVLSDK